MVLGFLKRRPRGTSAEPAPKALPERLPEEIAADEYAVSLHFRAKSSGGVRLEGRPRPASELHAIVQGLALGEVELFEPRPAEFADAAPLLEHPREAMQWLEAHGESGPVARHALRIFETVGAIDLAVDTLACALFHGDVDAPGQPEYDWVVGGAASHWDEGSGDLIVRAVVGWGGKGLAGGTDRIAQRLLSALYVRIVAQRDLARREAAGQADATSTLHGQVCAHCGFTLGEARAAFCPQCGMRLPPA